MKKYLPIGSLIVGLGFTVILLFAVVFTSTSGRFPVTFFPENTIPGYATSLAYYNVFTSPAVARSHAPGFLALLAWVCFVAMWIAIWWVGTDRHQPKGSVESNLGKGDRTGMGIFIIALPLVLSVVFFFTGYSGRYGNNSVQVAKPLFESWVASGAIKQKNEKTYVDNSKEKVLKNLFKDKEFIR